MHNHSKEVHGTLEPGETCDICENTKDTSFPAYVIGGSLLLGAILIAASLIYSTGRIVKQMDAATASQAAAGFFNNPSGQQAGAQVGAPQQAAQAPGTPVKLNIKANQPFLGSGSAKVTVVEYADYRCPFCERWYTSTWPTIKAKYVDTGKIKFIYQDFAFLGPNSYTAAEAAHCAGDQNKFWQYHEYLFQNQGSESTDWASIDNQKKFAQTLGLNTSQFNQCLDSGKYKQEVLDETAAGKASGVTGTPTVFVNGVAIVGAQPTDQFVKAIDAALAK